MVCSLTINFIIFWYFYFSVVIFVQKYQLFKFSLLDASASESCKCAPVSSAMSVRLYACNKISLQHGAMPGTVGDDVYTEHVVQQIKCQSTIYG
jgi:hypothetical protein